MNPKPRKTIVLLAVLISAMALSSCGTKERSTESVTEQVTDKVADTITSTFDPVIQAATDQSAYSSADAVYRELQAVAGFENVTIDDAYIDRMVQERYPDGEYDPSINSVTIRATEKVEADGETTDVIGVAYVCVDGASKEPCA
jgi:hypothetical protein